jgi:NAD(P)-dependent dehydrogenase (short-subunit alcohol dehydrogenase family)
VQAHLPSLRHTAAERQPVRGAKIVALSSMAAVVPEADLAAYSASKSAMAALCESVSASEWRSGIAATAISPGYVDTRLTEWVHDAVPPSEMITVDDIAEVVMALTRLSRWAYVPNIPVCRAGSNPWRA